MSGRRLGLSIGLLICALPSACWDEPSGPAENHPPQACFTMMRSLDYMRCPEKFLAGLDPRCTADAESPPESLSVRWDYENDGTWDTDFLPLARHTDYHPSRPLPPVWEARCEVLDPDGATTIAIRSVDLTGVIPIEPDLMAGELEIVSEFGEKVTEVASGQAFEIRFYTTCWADTTLSDLREQYYLNGEPWFERRPMYQYSYGCGSHGGGSFALEEPGDHVISVQMDADDLLEEGNETNNVSSTTLRVTE